MSIKGVRWNFVACSRGACVSLSNLIERVVLIPVSNAALPRVPPRPLKLLLGVVLHGSRGERTVRRPSDPLLSAQRMCDCFGAPPTPLTLSSLYDRALWQLAWQLSFWEGSSAEGIS